MDLEIIVRDENGEVLSRQNVYQDGSDSEAAEWIHNAVKEKFPGAKNTKLDDFLDHYTGNPEFNFQESEGCEGQMETYSPYVERVKEQFDINPRTVWTIVDSDDMSRLIAITGMHFVNRFLYFVSNEEWQDEEEEYEW